MGVVEQCQSGTWVDWTTGGCTSRRAFKTDISYVDDAYRATLADETLRMPRSEFQLRTHVDLYGSASMLLATVQNQQKQIDELKKQVDALEHRGR